MSSAEKLKKLESVRMSITESYSAACQLQNEMRKECNHPEIAEFIHKVTNPIGDALYEVTELMEKLNQTKL